MTDGTNCKHPLLGSDRKCAWASRLQGWIDTLLPKGHRTKVHNWAGRATSYDWANEHLTTNVEKRLSSAGMHLALLDYSINAKFNSDEASAIAIEELFIRRLLELPTKPAVVFIETMYRQPYTYKSDDTTNTTVVSTGKWRDSGKNDLPLAHHYGLHYLSMRDAMAPDASDPKYLKNWGWWFTGPHPDWVAHQILADMVCQWWHGASLTAKCPSKTVLETLFDDDKTPRPADDPSSEPLPTPAFEKLVQVKGCVGKTITTRYNPRLQQEFELLNLRSGTLFNSFDAGVTVDGKWRLYEDRPGKVGFINNGTLGSVLSLPVTCGQAGLARVEYFKTRPGGNAGRARVWWSMNSASSSSSSSSSCSTAAAAVDVAATLPSFPSLCPASVGGDDVMLDAMWVWRVSGSDIASVKCPSSHKDYMLNFELVPFTDAEDAAKRGGNKFKVIGITAC
jgi:hypothetical protein